LADRATPTAFLSVHFLLAGQKKVNIWFSLSGRSERKCAVFPLTLLGAGFFGYFFFVAGDKEKVTIQPQMLWLDFPSKNKNR